MGAVWDNNLPPCDPVIVCTTHSELAPCPYDRDPCEWSTEKLEVELVLKILAGGK